MPLQRIDEVNGQNVRTLPACNQAGSIEASLVVAAKCGDAAAFEELARRHQRRLRRIAQRITHNREDAEDAVQRSLLQAFVHLTGFRGDSEFSTWLTRIVMNEALMNQRKNFRRNEVPLNESSGTEDAYLHSEVAKLGPSPEESYSCRELQQVLCYTIRGLKPNSRSVFQLRHLKQLSTKATAGVVALPIPTVKTRLRRSRLELRLGLAKHSRPARKHSRPVNEKNYDEANRGETMSKRRFVINTILGLALWVSAPRSLAAEEAPAANGVPAHLLVTVEARHGSNPLAISREDVTVYEGRDRDQVTDWVPAQGDNAGLELFILLDDSSNTSVGSQLEDLRQFIISEPASTNIGVAYMQDGIARIQQNLTSDHALAAKALRLPMGISGVNASPYFSLSDLVKRWPIGSARREVLMVSDGIDRYYDSSDLLDPYLASTIEDAQRAGVIVFAIYTPGAGHYGHSYWRTYWGQIYLSQVADETGGESYYIGFTGPPVTFAPYLDDLAQRLTHQYLLAVAAKPQKKNGLQRVKVMTEVPNAELVSADKVYVPAAEP